MVSMQPDPFEVKDTSLRVTKNNEGHINTHNLKVHFGKHEGELWTRIPLSYLKFCINSMDTSSMGYQIAAAEINRRGTNLNIDKLELSYHSIDRASIHFMQRYFDEASKDEGIYSWLHRRALEALEKRNAKGVAIVDGIKFIYAEGNKFATLKTVVPTHHKK